MSMPFFKPVSLVRVVPVSMKEDVFSSVGYFVVSASLSKTSPYPQQPLTVYVLQGWAGPVSPSGLYDGMLTACLVS